jgi:hypothetical protein
MARPQIRAGKYVGSGHSHDCWKLFVSCIRIEEKPMRSFQWKTTLIGADY